MKRIFAMFAVLALMAGMAMAAPSMYGSNGLIRTISPTNCGPMSWSIGARGFYSMGTVNSAGTGYTAEFNWKNIELLPEGYFAFNDMLEFSVAPSYRYLLNSGTITPTVGAAIDTTLPTENGSLDTRFGLKATFIRGEGFNLGTYLGYDFRWSKKFSGYYGWDGSAYVKDSAYSPMGTIHFMAIPGFDMGAVKLNLNVGLDYNLDSYDDTLTPIYPTMAVPFGLGFSYKASDMLTPFVEVTGSYVMDTNYYYKAYTTPVDSFQRGLMNNPLWITGGLRFAFGNVKLDVGGEYNLQTKDSTLGDLDRKQDWQAFMGLSYGICNLGPKVPVTAILTGKVTDAKGKGLAATVTAAGLTANTDPATGVYTLAGLPVTKLPTEIKAEAKLYIVKSASVILTKKNKKTPAVQDFALDLKPIPMGAAKGMVKDAMGAPVEASIAFAGPKAETAKVVAGAYNVNLQVGNYTATVTAAGYFDKMATIAITEKGTAMNDFAMLKKGAVVPVEVVWTAANKAMIKTVNVGALVKMIQDNPKAKITVTAYVDRVGGKKMNQKLATDRADAIRAELVKATIDAARITTVGQLVVPAGKTNAVRATNTKVEVSFVE